MTGVRTEWHLAELSEAEGDPFQGVVYSTGVTLDLTAGDDVLVQQYHVLVRREQRMAATGLTCPLKAGGQDCRSCQEATLDPDVPLARLCRLGKDEAMLEAVIEERMDEASLRGASVRELVAAMEEASELGEIPDDLAELLTSVGL